MGDWKDVGVEYLIDFAKNPVKVWRELPSYFSNFVDEVAEKSPSRRGSEFIGTERSRREAATSIYDHRYTLGLIILGITGSYCCFF